MLPEVISDTRNLLEQYNLVRYPRTGDKRLLAFNGADRLILDHLFLGPLAYQPLQRLLIVNDEHGALAVACHQHSPACWNDSKLSEMATRRNMTRNSISSELTFIPASDTPDGVFDQVILRIPKSKDLLQHQLNALHQITNPGARLICGGMDKHLGPGISDVLGRVCGTTKRLPGRFKAHVYETIFDSLEPGDRNSLPRELFHYWQSEKLGGEVANAPGCFSREKLDIGARIMLASFGDLKPAKHIIDLACGNGVLGIAACQKLKPQSMYMVDESAMAIASARENARRFLGNQPCSLVIEQSDGLENYQGPPPDLILLNPPFHHQFTIDESIGPRLLKQAARRLAHGGRIWIVANRHLNYARHCEKLLGNSRVVNADSKFSVIEARA